MKPPSLTQFATRNEDHLFSFYKTVCVVEVTVHGLKVWIKREKMGGEDKKNRSLFECSRLGPVNLVRHRF